MAKKFINWDNLEYIIESMQKFLIDHNGLDNHLDVFWEARERVTDNMKYGRDITGCTYTKEQYESLINPETSSYLEGTFVGVAEKNKSQDDRMTTIEAKNVEQDGRLGAVEAKNVEQDGRLVAIEAKNTEQDGRLGAVEAKNVEQDGKLANVYTKTETDSQIAAAKKSILTGESTEQLNESYDTLLEVYNWIDSHGKDAAALLEAITTLSSRVEEIEKDVAGIDPKTTAKINDLRRILDDIAYVEWDVNAWGESTEESTGEAAGEATDEATGEVTGEATDEATGESTGESTGEAVGEPTEESTPPPTE